jgi:hypothetical protein
MALAGGMATMQVGFPVPRHATTAALDGKLNSSRIRVNAAA